MAIEAENIIRLCALREIPVMQLEKDLGLYNGYIGVRKNPGRKIKYAVCEQCADYLQVDISEIVGNQAPENKDEKLGNDKPVKDYSYQTMVINGETYTKVSPQLQVLINLASPLSEHDMETLLRVARALKTASNK